jgi:HSP20 family molecular chaperone IbpA
MAAKSSGVRKVKEAVSLEAVEFESLVTRLQGLSEQIARRAYEIFEHECGVCGHDMENWLRAEREILHPIHVAVVETDQTVDVTAEVPGFTESQLKVSIQPRHLIITGKKESGEKEQKGKIVHADECASEIFRMIELPAEVNALKVSTKLKDGVLTLSIPKVEKVKAIRQAKAA